MKSLFVAVAVFLFMESDSFAQDLNNRWVIQCRSGIASIGNTVSDLLYKCGQPKYVAGNTWVYDFGPAEFIYQVEVNNGKIKRIISTDEKGTKS